MENLKKENEQKNESELTEKLNTEFPLSGGETTADLENALKNKDSEETDEDEEQYP